ncbi:PAS domain S-box protein, partial [bacterium]|nr:PAS domain S-box protein [bacterium]
STDDRQRAADSDLARLRREAQRLRAENEFLRQKEQTFHLVFESASDAIVTIDQCGQILHVNAGVQHVFGHSPEDLAGQPIERLIPEDLRESHSTGLRRFLRTGQRQRAWAGLRTRGLHRDGYEISIEVSFGAMRLPDGSYRFTGIMRDVTRHVEKEASERQQLNDLAHQQRLRAVNEMATGLAHELNQPLLAICLQADAAAQLCPDVRSAQNSEAGSSGADSNSDLPSELRGALLEIADQAERASRIIRSVRELVRRKEPRRETVTFPSLIETVLPICELYAARAGIELAIRMPARLPQVRVDAVQIEQVLVNLIQNAVEAMEQSINGPRVIEISAAAGSPDSETDEAGDGRCLKVSVRDHGIGLPDASAQRVFDSFYTTRPDGVGLGLAICRTIVEDHGGRISATAANPGAEFSFTLPIDHCSLTDGSTLEDRHV